MSNPIENVLHTVETGIVDFGKLVGEVFHNIGTVDKTLRSLSPDVKAAMAMIFADVLKLVASAEGAVATNGVNIAADSAVIAVVEKLLADAKAGEKLVVDSLKTLGIKL